eukprot:3924034-Pyramimonas_sp.AAC.1
MATKRMSHPIRRASNKNHHSDQFERILLESCGQHHAKNVILLLVDLKNRAEQLFTLLFTTH